MQSSHQADYQIEAHQSVSGTKFLIAPLIWAEGVATGYEHAQSVPSIPKKMKLVLFPQLPHEDDRLLTFMIFLNDYCRSDRFVSNGFERNLDF